MNTNCNFLILWNAVNDSEEVVLKLFLNKLLTLCESEKAIKCKFVFSEEQLKTELGESDTEFSEKNLSHIIVLCELTWENRKFSEYYGIELVQQKIRVKHNNRKAINLPILFVSFCTREQIIRMDQTKEIINTYGLRNHFIQLPKATEKEVSDFWEMKPATELEMIDTLHFCAYDKMIASIRHGISAFDIDELSPKVLQIIDKIGIKYNLVDIKRRVLKCEKIADFKQICEDFEQIIIKGGDNSGLIKGKEYHVILIDDEVSENIKSLIADAEKYNVIIEQVTETEYALKLIEEDIDNNFSVIISDYRIWDVPSDIYNRKMLYPQGYSFIEKTLEYRRLYKYLAFSELPRDFRMKVLTRLNIRIEPINKEIMISTEELRKEFIERIVDLAKENTYQSISLACEKEYFKILYFRFLTEKNFIDDNFISTQSNELIKKYDSLFDANIKYFFDGDKEGQNQYAIEWNKIKSDFNLQATYEPISIDDFYIGKFQKFIKEALADIKEYTREIKTYNDIASIIEVSDIATDSIYYILNNEGKKIVCENILKYKFEQSAKRIIDKFYNGQIKNNKTIYNLLIKNMPYSPIESKDPYTDEAFEKFTYTLIARRLAIFLYFKVESFADKNVEQMIVVTQRKETDFTETVETESQLSKHITTAVNRVLVNGNLTYASKNFVTSKGLFLSPKKGKGITELNDIAMTNEEKNFFRINYPDLYEKWNK